MGYQTVLTIALVAGLRFFAHALVFTAFDIPPATVSSLNASAYMGRWYQMYTSLIPTTTFEKDGFCVTADYFDPSVTFDKITFKITNSENVGGANGKLKQAIGTAVNGNPSGEPGKYKISFEDSSMPSITGSYWIVQVGDIPSGSKQYPWAIVSVPFQAMLWVLARDLEEFSQQYEQSVMQTVADLGFTYFFNKPIKTYQSKSACSYAAEPPR